MNDEHILWDVIEEHLDEAAFLWTQWERAKVAPNCTLKDVVRGPEERLLAHIDALVVAGDPAVERVLVPALEGDEPDAVLAAALALLDGPDANAVARVRARLARAEPPVARALTRALGLTHRADIVDALLLAARTGAPAQIAAALAALAVRRVPVPGLASFLVSRDPAILAPALAAARASGQENARHIEAHFASQVTAVRDAALETGLVLGMRSAWRECQRIADEKRPDAAFPLLVIATSGEDGDLQRILAALKVEELRAPAVVALGYTGRAAAVEASLPLLAEAKLARLAGEAVSAIAGLEIDGEYRREKKADGEEEEDGDGVEVDLAVRPEDLLAEPNAEAVEGWWKGARGRFEGRGRYLGGKAWSVGVLGEAFEKGSMRRRRGLGVEIAVREKRDVAVRGWGRGRG